MSIEDLIPETLEEAIQVVIENTSKEDIERIREGEEYSHFGVGMYLRNSWGLWHDSILAQHFKNRFGLGHADDMSGLIVGGAMCQIRGDEFHPDAISNGYKIYWKKMGVDPLTQKELTQPNI